MFVYPLFFLKNDDGCESSSFVQYIESIYHKKKKYLKLVMQYSFVRYFGVSDIFLMGRIWMNLVMHVLEDILHLGYGLMIFLLGLSNRSYSDSLEMLTHGGALLISSICLDVFSVLVVAAIGFFRTFVTVKEFGFDSTSFTR